MLLQIIYVTLPDALAKMRRIDPITNIDYTITMDSIRELSEHEVADLWTKSKDPEHR